jgi:predicted sulfurtransferase
MKMMGFDERLSVLIEEWRQQTARQIRCQNEGTDHDLCPKCNEQLYFCDCADRMAQTILELQFGFTDFEEE